MRLWKGPKPPTSSFFIQQKISEEFHFLKQRTRMSRPCLNHSPKSSTEFSSVLLPKIHPKEKWKLPNYDHTKYYRTSRNKNPYFTCLQKIQTQMEKWLVLNMWSRLYLVIFNKFALLNSHKVDSNLSLRQPSWPGKNRISFLWDLF